ncbi:MAG: hypothetical protein WCW33_01500 [Candidatus Babeliales bacterium]
MNHRSCFLWRTILFFAFIGLMHFCTAGNLTFVNRESAFVLNPNARFYINPTQVASGWGRSSIIKKRTGEGDYNIAAYAGGDKIVSFSEAPTDLVYDNSNAIASLDSDITANSNTILYLDRIDSNAKLFLTKNNSNTLLYLSRTNSNALLYCCRTTSNALLFGNRTNSNAIIRLDRAVRTDSNAFAYGIRNNSNAIIKLTETGADLSRTTSNALLYCCRTTSNALLFGNRTNSNAIIRLDRTVRTDSNAFAYGIRNNSNAIIKLTETGADLSRTTSNALLYCCRTTSNALLFGDRTNSNAIIRLDRTVRTDSNAFARGIRNNSNAILKLASTTSNLVINNSNAIVKLDVTTRTNSNALLYCCRTTSNALLFGNRTNSNAIIRLDRTVRTESNAFARGIRNNSNAILKLALTTSNLVINNSNAIIKLDVTVRTNSNAQLYCCRTTSNALLFGDRTNSNAQLYCCRNSSNAIIKLDRTVRTDSNAFARGIRNNSNAILKLASTTSNLVINNSNAIVKLDVTARTNSNALLYCCRTTSNSLLFGDRTNSNAIIRLDRTVRTDSNAFARGIRNNSNAIIHITSDQDELSRTTSNALLYCCKNTSNALLFGDRNNSNAIISIVSTTSNQFAINNSNAITWINQQLQTIDHGPSNITIATTSYQLISDIFLSSDHRMYIHNSCVINGNGHSINLTYPAKGVIDITAGSTVVFHHVAFRNYTDAIFNLSAGASVIFGDGVHLELLQAQTLERQWTFTGSSEICGNGKELAVDPYAIVVAPHSRLNIHGVALTGLKNTNLICSGSTASLTLSEVGIYLDNSFNFTAGAIVFDPDVVIVGTNTFVYASDMTSSIARDSQLYLSGITFSYAPQIANRDLFAMVDQSSRFFIDGCTLTSTTTGMRLTRGMLIADHKNFLVNAGGESLSEGFAFGDGNPAHDLSIEVKPGGSLNLVAGYWDYVNN